MNWLDFEVKGQGHSENKFSFLAEAYFLAHPVYILNLAVLVN